jgi:RNA polymerase sigma-70 factor (ECF subfamily)
VVGVITKMLRDPIEAEDLAQQVFLRVWKHARRWKPEAKFTTYLFTITRRLVYNESRRRSRRREISSDQQRDAIGQEPAAPARLRPDAEAERSETHERIDAAIAALPESQRTAVILYSYESLPYEEIAKVLGTSIPSVKSLLFRARSTLKGQLADLLHY